MSRRKCYLTVVFDIRELLVFLQRHLAINFILKVIRIILNTFFSTKSHLNRKDVLVFVYDVRNSAYIHLHDTRIDQYVASYVSRYVRNGGVQADE